MDKVFFNGRDKWQLEFKNKAILSKDFSHVDDYMKSHEIKEYEQYSQWFTNLHSMDTGRINTFMKAYIKVNSLMSPGTITWNYIYIDNTWSGFSDIESFETIGLIHISEMVTNHWSEYKAKEFLSNKLLFLPVSERLSVIISIP